MSTLIHTVPLEFCTLSSSPFVCAFVAFLLLSPFHCRFFLSLLRVGCMICRIEESWKPIVSGDRGVTNL